MKRKCFKTVILFCLCTFFYSMNGQEELHSDVFKNPQAASKVHTWWHWMNGNITKEGITKDLESMKNEGIVQATILNIGGFTRDDLIDKTIKFGSPEWYDMFQFSLKEANRLGISIGVHNCDGWNTSGGPWITPEFSMKTYVWTKTYVAGGKTIHLKLEQPQEQLGYYQDYAVIAFPAEEKANSFQKSKPQIKLNDTDTKSIFYDGNPKSLVSVRRGDKIKIKLSDTQTVNKLVLFGYQTFSWSSLDEIRNKFSLSSSKDGINYSKISDLELVGMNKSVTAFFKETKAKYFELECLANNLLLAEVELLYNDEEPEFSSGIPRLLQKTVHVRATNETDFDSFDELSVPGIPENSIIDITQYFSPDGTLKWEAPKGKWCIIRFGYTTTGKTNHPATNEGRGLECDKLDPDALNLHFNSFSQKLIDASGDYLGNTFKFLLVDSWECEYPNWTQKFPDEFVKRRGYDIKKWIPVLCGEIVENAQHSNAFIYDFRKTISELIDVNYYRPFRDLCHKNKLEMHAEIIYGEDGVYPPLDILKSNRYPDMPMYEFWAKQNQDQIVEYTPVKKPFVSFPTESALANAKPVIGAEAYTGYAHFSETPALLKPYSDMAYCAGINQMILHSYVHQPIDNIPHVTLGPFASHFNRNNPWWEYAQDWLTYQARVQSVLQNGEPVTDLMFYVGDKLPQYLPKNFLEKELPIGYRANACNLSMLLNEAKIINGMLSFGGKQSFPLLVLPNSTAMEYTTLQRIAELINEGLTVYGPKPTELLSLSEIRNNTDDFKKLADAVWGKMPSNESTYGKGKIITGKPIGKVIDELNLVPDFTTNHPDEHDFLYIHKKIGDMDAYFVFNQQNKSLNRELLFRVKNKIPEIWNPESGFVSMPAIYSSEKEQIRIPVAFKPYESLFFIFRNGSSENSIHTVFLDKEKIFPGSSIVDREIPIVTFNDNYNFTTNASGWYSFVTSTGEKMKLGLIPQKKANIVNYKATLEFSPLYDETIEPIEVSELKSLTDSDNPSIKYFAGKIKYTISFDAPDDLDLSRKSFLLNMGEMSATAEVYLNGKLLKHVWRSDDDIPFSGLKKTGNKLEVTVATACRNRFIGDLIQYGKVRNIPATTSVTAFLKKDTPLTPSGIIGPLKISEIP